MPTEPDLSEFLRLQTTKRPCPVAAALEKLTPADRETLEAALATDKSVIKNTAIEKWLGRREMGINANAIASHRRGTCACG